MKTKINPLIEPNPLPYLVILCINVLAYNESKQFIIRSTTFYSRNIDEVPIDESASRVVHVRRETSLMKSSKDGCA